MKIKHYIIFTVFFWLIFPQIGKSTHIVGGELNYTCLGGNTYEITLTIFRDCFNGDPNAWFDNPASVGVFDANNMLVSSVGNGGQLLMPLMNNDTLEPILFDECLEIPGTVCVHTTTYRDTLDLPFVTGGYTLAYQRCCRNVTIQNIVDPLATGATYSVEITEAALQECNSNAKFNEWPPIYICVNEPIEFDHSATDIDGDSLVYILCTPFQGADQTVPQPQPPNNPPFDPVVWFTPTYGLNNMLGGIPLSIDSETGFLTGTPNTVGQFVVGICVEEYRNGQLISTSRRDFQYNIDVCSQPISSFFLPEVNCDGLTADFDNLSTNSFTYLWQFNDPGNPGATSTLSAPSYTFSDTGTYNVTLIAEPDSVCADTFNLSFTMLYPSLFSEFELDLVDCDSPFVIEMFDLSYDTISTIVDWEWTVNGNIYSNNQFPPTYVETGNTNSVTVGLTVTAENECVETLEQTINYGINVSVPDSIYNCEPSDSFRLNVEGILPNDTLTFNWEPSIAIIGDGNTGMPLVDLTAAVNYFVTITDQDGCEYIDSVFIDNTGTPPPLSVTATPDTIYIGETSQLEATLNPDYIYDWMPSNTIGFPNIYNPVAAPQVTTEYSVNITDGFGCLNEAFITIVVLNPECVDPFVFMPNAFTPNGDSENDILKLEGRIIDEMYLAIYNRWGQKVFETFDQSIGWDGTFKGELLEPDVFGFYLKVKCVNGEEFFKKGNISLLK